ncbi:MAG: hypothetical protein F9K35_17765 [Burkholderiaceae bacterium]|nr:MAG: hypothetical protein F9K35_17765 [Burkholderiaceae bacterium]
MPGTGARNGAVGAALLWGAAACGAAASPAPTEAQCRAEVSRFEQAIGLVRQTSGHEAAAKLKERLLPAQQEALLLAREGYCGLARYLREHKLTEPRTRF